MTNTNFPITINQCEKFKFPGEHVHRSASDVGARGHGGCPHALSDLHECLHFPARSQQWDRQELRDRHSGLYPRRSETRQETPSRTPGLHRENERHVVLVSGGCLRRATPMSVFTASFY